MYPDQMLFNQVAQSYQDMRSRLSVYYERIVQQLHVAVEVQSRAALAEDVLKESAFVQCVAQFRILTIMDMQLCRADAVPDNTSNACELVDDKHEELERSLLQVIACMPEPLVSTSQVRDMHWLAYRRIERHKLLRHQFRNCADESFSLYREVLEAYRDRTEDFEVLARKAMMSLNGTYPNVATR